VLVTALERLAGVPEEKRAWGHQAAARRRAVLEGARHHDGDRGFLVPLFERSIVRTGRANDVGNRPAIALVEDSHLRPYRGALIVVAPKRSIGSDRNFCQDTAPRLSHHF